MLTLGGGETVDEARTPLILDHDGGRIALLACNWVGPYYAFASDDATATGGVRPGAADCRGSWLRETVSALDAEADVVIVTIQYLEVDQYTPTEQNRYDFRAVADWGADVVIGTSSHFPQTFEFYANARGTDSLIHYGLGNLYFDQQFFAGVRFFMDGVYIYEGRVLTIDLFTGLIEAQARPRAMDAAERENFLYLIFNEYGGM
jgi:poly-gamma-glutamate synthesis protein (capsule biosynthesis protein)